MILTFGRHKGKELAAVPRGYIRWLLTTDIDRELRLACRAALKHEDYTVRDIECDIITTLTCDETIIDTMK